MVTFCFCTIPFTGCRPLYFLPKNSKEIVKLFILCQVARCSESGDLGYLSTINLIVLADVMKTRIVGKLSSTIISEFACHNFSGL